MPQNTDITLYQTSAFTTTYSQDGSFDDPVWPKSSITWDGEAGEIKDIQIWVRNDGSVEAFDVEVDIVDIDGTDESTWTKLAATQAGLPGATAGASLALGNFAVTGTTNFWLRTQVPVGSDPRDKTDLRIRSTASWSSSSSSSQSSSSSSSDNGSPSSSSSSESSSSSQSSCSSSCSSSSSSSFQITRGIRPFSATLPKPANIEADLDNPTIFPIDIEWAPFGVTFTKLGIKIKPSGNYVATYQRWVSPTDPSPDDMATLTIVGGTEAATILISNAHLANDFILMLSIPNTDVTELVAHGAYIITTVSSSSSSSSSSST